MRIYIDESGIFKPEPNKPSSVSCITALIVPNVLEKNLFNAFNQWKQLPSLQNKENNSNEIKGSKLDEKEISSLLLLLSRFDVIIEVVCVDTGKTTDSEVARDKLDLSTRFLNSQIGAKVNNKFNKDVLMSLPDQLYLQGLLLFQLVNEVLKQSIPYYVQRFPKDLGSFDWFIDAKNKNITEYETISTHLVMPFLQAINHTNPSYYLVEEDYSAFSKYLISEKDLVDKKGLFSINEIMKNLSFEQSETNVGIQIVDILANCIRRAMSDHLQFEGWKYLSNLIIRREKQSIMLTKLNLQITNSPFSYAKFVNYFQCCGKQMLVPNSIKPKIKLTNKGYIKWCYAEDLSCDPIKVVYLENY